VNERPTKYYFRQRQQNRLYDTVIGAVEDAANCDGVRKKDIAETLSVPPSQVTRWLSGPANWTADTISDLLFSVGAELDFRVVRFSERAKGNRFHPAGERWTSGAPISAVGPLPTPSTTAREISDKDDDISIRVSVE
jgi:hypothetical protein